MNTPWSKVNGLAFMRGMLWNGVNGKDDEKATLTVESRRDCASRQWWTMEWTGADGKKQSVSASTAELVFQRAAERELQIRAKQREEPAHV